MGHNHHVLFAQKSQSTRLWYNNHALRVLKPLGVDCVCEQCEGTKCSHVCDESVDRLHRHTRFTIHSQNHKHTLNISLSLRELACTQHMHTDVARQRNSSLFLSLSDERVKWSESLTHRCNLFSHSRAETTKTQQIKWNVTQRKQNHKHTKILFSLYNVWNKDTEMKHGCHILWLQSRLQNLLSNA